MRVMSAISSPIDGDRTPASVARSAFAQDHVARRLALGARHHADVPRLVDLADVDLRVGGAGEARRPFDGLVDRLHRHDEVAVEQLVRTDERSLRDRARSAGEREPHTVHARPQSLAGSKPTPASIIAPSSGPMPAISSGLGGAPASR